MKTKKISSQFAIIFILLGLVFFTIKPASAQGKSNQSPQYGGVLKIILPSGISTLGSPSEAGLATEYNVIAAAQLEALLRHDNQFRIMPRLAESIDVAQNGKTITLYLRKGIKFQDGTNFNATSVEYCMRNYTQRDVQPSYMKAISTYEIVDDYTIRLHLSEFNLNLLFNLVWGAGFALSPKALQKTTTPEKMAYDHMVGTGAFQLVDFERDVKAIFKKYDSYWQKGKPYLDGIEFHQIADPVTAVMALKSGQGHLLYRVTPEQAVDLEAAGFNVVPENLNPIGYITPDGANPDSPFGNINVRKALEYAIDRKTLAEGIGMGYYKAVTQFAGPNDSHYLPGLAPRDYDPKKAKQLLAEAGYSEGFKTKIMAMTTENRDVLVALQSYLGEVGIEAKLDIMDRALLFKTMHEGWKNGILVNPFPCNTGLPVKIEMFFSADAKIGRLVMGSAYKPNGWQEKLIEAVNQPDESKRLELTKHLVKMMYDHAMAIPMWTRPHLTAIDPKVNDIQWGEGHGFFWEPQNTWLSK